MLSSINATRVAIQQLTQAYYNATSLPGEAAPELDRLSHFRFNISLSTAPAIAQNITRAPTTSSDLAQDILITLPENASTLARNLSTVAEIYGWVREAVKYEPYYGALKGAASTYYQRAGNDIDQASLLIGMLRELGIPSRYTCGAVRVNKTELAQLLDVPENRTLQVLRENGIPVAENGSYIEMEHCWVAYYDNASDAWIELDPSWNPEPRERISNLTTSNDTLSGKEIYIANLSGELLSFKEPNLSGYTIPGVLPYQVLSRNEEFGSVPKRLRFTTVVRVLYRGKEIISFSAPSVEIAKAELSVRFNLTSEASQLVATLGNETPPFLLNYTAAIYFNSSPVNISSQPLPYGSALVLEISTLSPIGNFSANATLTAGSQVSVVTVLGKADGESFLSFLNASASLVNASDDEVLAQTLSALGHLYYAMTDSAYEDIAAKELVNWWRSVPSYSLLALNPGLRFGIPLSYNRYGIYIDALYNAISASPKPEQSSAEEALRTFVYHTGIAAGLYESVAINLVAEDLGSVSISDVFTQAVFSLIPVEKINASNYASLKHRLFVPPNVRAVVEDAIARGYIVEMPLMPVRIRNTTYIALRIIDPATGAVSNLVYTTHFSHGALSAAWKLLKTLTGKLRQFASMAWQVFKKGGLAALRLFVNTLKSIYNGVKSLVTGVVEILKAAAANEYWVAAQKLMLYVKDFVSSIENYKDFLSSFELVCIPVKKLFDAVDDFKKLIDKYNYIAPTCVSANSQYFASGLCFYSETVKEVLDEGCEKFVDGLEIATLVGSTISIPGVGPFVAGLLSCAVEKLAGDMVCGTFGKLTGYIESGAVSKCNPRLKIEEVKKEATWANEEKTCNYKIEVKVVNDRALPVVRPKVMIGGGGVKKKIDVPVFEGRLGGRDSIFSTDFFNIKTPQTLVISIDYSDNICYVFEKSGYMRVSKYIKLDCCNDIPKDTPNYKAIKACCEDKDSEECKKFTTCKGKTGLELKCCLTDNKDKCCPGNPEYSKLSEKEKACCRNPDSKECIELECQKRGLKGKEYECCVKGLSGRDYACCVNPNSDECKGGGGGREEAGYCATHPNDPICDPCLADPSSCRPPPPDDIIFLGNAVVDYYNESKEAKIGVLKYGFAEETLTLLGMANVSAEYVDLAQANIDDLNKYDAIFVPSGGLHDIAAAGGLSSTLGAKLRSYVANGGRLIVFSQEYGYIWNSIPGDLKGFGYQEDSLCFKGGSYISAFHPVIASQDSEYVDANVDGFFTEYPPNATVIMRRTKNDMPVMLLYSYGKGEILATTLYPDFSVAFGSTTKDEIDLIKDIALWINSHQKPFTLGENITLSFAIPENVTGYVIAIDPDGKLFDVEELNETVTLKSATKPGRYAVDIVKIDFSKRGESYDNRTFFANITTVKNFAGFVVSRFNESLGRIQAKDVVLSVTTSQDTYFTGDTVSARAYIRNNRNTTLNATLRVGYVFWSLYDWKTFNVVYVPMDVQSCVDYWWKHHGVNCYNYREYNISVPPGGSYTVSFSYKLEDPQKRDFRAFAELRDENGSRIALADKVYRIKHSDVGVSLTLPDREVYNPGEAISAGAEVTSRQNKSYTLLLELVDLENGTLYWNKSLNISLPSTKVVHLRWVWTGGGFTSEDATLYYNQINFSFSVPSVRDKYFSLRATVLDGKGVVARQVKVIRTLSSEVEVAGVEFPEVLKEGTNTIKVALKNRGNSTVSGLNIVFTLTYPNSTTYRYITSGVSLNPGEIKNISKSIELQLQLVEDGWIRKGWRYVRVLKPYFLRYKIYDNSWNLIEKGASSYRPEYHVEVRYNSSRLTAGETLGGEVVVVNTGNVEGRIKVNYTIDSYGYSAGITGYLAENANFTLPLSYHIGNITAEVPLARVYISLESDPSRRVEFYSPPPPIYRHKFIVSPPEKRNFTAGENITVSIANVGEDNNISISAYLENGVWYYLGSKKLGFAKGDSKNVNFTIPSDLFSGDYTLYIYADGSGWQYYRKSLPVYISGYALNATLLSRSYDADENISILVKNTGALPLNGTFTLYDHRIHTTIRAYIPPGNTSTLEFPIPEYANGSYVLKLKYIDATNWRIRLTQNLGEVYIKGKSLRVSMPAQQNAFSGGNISVLVENTGGITAEVKCQLRGFGYYRISKRFTIEKGTQVTTFPIPYVRSGVYNATLTCWHSNPYAIYTAYSLVNVTGFDVEARLKDRVFNRSTGIVVEFENRGADLSNFGCEAKVANSRGYYLGYKSLSSFKRGEVREIVYGLPPLPYESYNLSLKCSTYLGGFSTLLPVFIKGWRIEFGDASSEVEANDSINIPVINSGGEDVGLLCDLIYNNARVATYPLNLKVGEGQNISWRVPVDITGNISLRVKCYNNSLGLLEEEGYTVNVTTISLDFALDKPSYFVGDVLKLNLTSRAKKLVGSFSYTLKLVNSSGVQASTSESFTLLPGESKILTLPLVVSPGDYNISFSARDSSTGRSFSLTREITISGINVTLSLPSSTSSNSTLNFTLINNANLGVRYLNASIMRDYQIIANTTANLSFIGKGGTQSGSIKVPFVDSGNYTFRIVIQDANGGITVIEKKVYISGYNVSFEISEIIQVQEGLNITVRNTGIGDVNLSCTVELENISIGGFSGVVKLNSSSSFSVSLPFNLSSGRYTMNISCNELIGGGGFCSIKEAYIKGFELGISLPESASISQGLSVMLNNTGGVDLNLSCTAWLNSKVLLGSTSATLGRGVTAEVSFPVPKNIASERYFLWVNCTDSRAGKTHAQGYVVVSAAQARVESTLPAYEFTGRRFNITTRIDTTAGNGSAMLTYLIERNIISKGFNPEANITQLLSTVLENATIFAAAGDGEKLYLAINGSLLRIDSQGSVENLSRFVCHTSAYLCSSMAIDTSGKVWISDRVGGDVFIRSYDGSGWREYNLTQIMESLGMNVESLYIRKMTADGRGNLWILVGGQLVNFVQFTGLIKYNGSFSYYPLGMEVQDIDAAGDFLWILYWVNEWSTTTTIVQRYNVTLPFSSSQAWRNYSYTQGFFNHSGYAIDAYGDRVWVYHSYEVPPEYYHGISYYDPATDTWKGAGFNITAGNLYPSKYIAGGRDFAWIVPFETNQSYYFSDGAFYNYSILPNWIEVTDGAVFFIIRTSGQALGNTVKLLPLGNVSVKKVVAGYSQPVVLNQSKALQSIALSTPGNYTLITLLLDSYGTLIAAHQAEFIIYPLNVSLSAATDRVAYRHGDDVMLKVNVTNNAGVAYHGTLYVYNGSTLLKTLSVNVDPGSTSTFEVKFTANASMNLTLRLENLSTTAEVRVEKPVFNLSLEYPSLVGISPFTLSAKAENVGNVSGYVNLTLDNESAASELMPGESLELSITRNTFFNTSYNFSATTDGSFTGACTGNSCTLALDVEFGENVDVNITAEDVYSPSGVVVYYSVLNRGRLPSSFTIACTIDEIALNRTITLAPGENTTGSLLFSNVSLGNHTLYCISPFMSYEKSIQVLEEDRVSIAFEVVQEDKLTIRGNITNVGANDVAGVLKLSTGFFSNTTDIFIPHGEKTEFNFTISIPPEITGFDNATVEVEAGGRVIASLTKEYEILPRFKVEPVIPLSFNAGANISLPLNISNIGSNDAQLRFTFTMPGIYEYYTSIFLPKGNSTLLNISFGIPEDLPEGEYDVIYTLNDIILYDRARISSYNFSINTYLDKIVYLPADTQANLTVELINHGSLNPNLTVRAVIPGYFEEEKNLTLATRANVSFAIPLNFTGEKKVHIGVHIADSGRSPYLTTRYIRVAEQNVTLYTDREFYSPGENATVFIESVLPENITLILPDGTELNLSLGSPAYTTGITQTATARPMAASSLKTNITFDIPNLRAGTYTIIYTFENRSYSYTFYVSGPEVVVKRVWLDKQSYGARDTANFTAIFTSNKQMNTTLKTMLFDPEGYRIFYREENITLTSGDNLVSQMVNINTTKAGAHRLVYVLYAEDAPIINNVTQSLAAGSVTVDVRGTTIMSLKPVNDSFNIKEDVKVSFIAQGNDNGTLTFYLDGQPLKSINITAQQYNGTVINLGRLNSSGIFNLTAVLDTGILSVKSTTLKVYNSMPKGCITSPVNTCMGEENTTARAGEVVTLSGWGYDTEDGNLTGRSIVWHSSIDGLLGYGENLSISNLSAGVHRITMTLLDEEGMAWIEEFRLYMGAQEIRETLNINGTIRRDYRQKVGMEISIATRENLSNVSLNITRFEDFPKEVSRESFSLKPIGKFIKIEADPKLKTNLSWAYIKIYYTSADLDTNGDGAVDVDENSLKLFKYDNATGKWIEVNESLPWVSEAGVNTTDFDNFSGYVYANITSFSVFGIGGEVLPAGWVPSPGGGGGGAAPSGYEVRVQKAEKERYTKLSLEPEKAYDIYEVEIKPRMNLYNARLKVEAVKKLPSYIAKVENKEVYRYLKLSFSSSALEEVKIRFRVNVSWLRDKDINPATVRLLRYSSGRWQELETEKLRAEDSRYILYEATSPGFSYFAIAGEAGSGFAEEKKIEEVVEKKEKAKVEIPEIPAVPEKKPAEKKMEKKPAAPAPKAEKPAVEKPAPSEKPKKRLFGICGPSAALVLASLLLLARRRIPI